MVLSRAAKIGVGLCPGGYHTLPDLCTRISPEMYDRIKTEGPCLERIVCG